MRRHGHKSHALIEALHSAQEAYGFLENDVLRMVATELRIPLSKVYGVATFYNFFTLKPQGRHTCVVCTGTACYIKGADQIMNVLEKKFDLKSGTTSPDGEVSVLTARCIRSCGPAPAAVPDGEVVNATPGVEPVLDAGVTSTLEGYFEESNARLADQLGRPLPW